MTGKNIVVAIASIMVVLAGLGLAVSGVVAPVWDGDLFIKRQLVYVGIGAVCAGLAAGLPWCTWLKTAPWLFGGWLILFCVSAAFVPISDWHSYVFMGSLKIWGWPAAILFVCWLRTKLQIRSSLLLVVLSIGLTGFLVMNLLADHNQLERVKIWMGLIEANPVSAEQPDWHATEQDLLHHVFSTSRWIGRSEDLARCFVPVAKRHTTAVIASTAAAFGKIFPISMVGLFAAAGVLMVWLWYRLTGAGKRLFVLLTGLSLCAPAFYGLFETFKLVPYLGIGMSIPWVSCGLEVTLIASVGLGVLWGIVKEDCKELMAHV